MGIVLLETRLFRRAVRVLNALVRPRAPIRNVARREIPYWRDRGWVRQGSSYRGSYQTPYGAFSGFIEDASGGYLRFYIFDPPPELQNSSHWQCFQPRGEQWFVVHMARMPVDVSSGIMSIERLLIDALRKHN